MKIGVDYIILNSYSELGQGFLHFAFENETQARYNRKEEARLGWVDWQVQGFMGFCHSVIKTSVCHFYFYTPQRFRT